MWSRWCAKQQRGIVPLRPLASVSGSHENGQLKSASAPSWRVTLGSLGKGLLAVCGVAIGAGTLYLNYTQSFQFSKEQVKKAFHRPVSKPVYKLPRLERNKLYLHVLSCSDEKILLIEGASGSGKTAAAQELMYNVSRSRQEGTRRGVLYYAPRRPVTNSKDFFDEIVRSCKAQIGSFNGYDALREACQESLKENYENRPLLVIDDAQKLAADDSVFDEIMGLLRGLMEIDGCDVILIVSNGSILKKARSCSGLSSKARLDYLKWPHVPDEEMKRYILENREQIFQKAKVNDDQISKFVKLFDSSFNDLRAIGTEDDVDSYMEQKRGSWQHANQAEG
jgi:Cdc6-like AAA superfamily ATPase